jgi:hypothetical protein
VAAADRSFAGGGEAAELLDVDVDELAGTLALVAVGRLRRLETAALAETDPLAPGRDVESARPSTSAISAAVIRSRRRAVIASIERSGVRWGIRFGAEERSSRPPSPSAASAEATCEPSAR